MDRPLEYDLGRLHGWPGWNHCHDLLAGDLQGNRHRSTCLARDQLLAMDPDGLHGGDGHAPGDLRPHLGYVWQGTALQSRVCHFRRRVYPALPGDGHRKHRRASDHHLPPDPGGRRSVSILQLNCHPDGCLSPGSAWHGYGDQPNRIDSGAVHRSGGWRPPGGRPLAGSVLGERSLFGGREHMGLHRPARNGHHPQAPEAGRPGQSLVCPRPDCGTGGGYLWVAVLRVGDDGLGKSLRISLLDRRCGGAGGVCGGGATCRSAHVPAEAVQDPDVRGRECGPFSRLTRPGWAQSHADHLAAGYLAAPPRLFLRGYPAVGGHLHDAVDGRLSSGRAAVRPFSRTATGRASSRPRACWSSLRPSSD